MIEIDGSRYSGSGTILRYGASLATLTGRPFSMTRVRARRERPGLRPQHLQALRACCELSGGRLEGDRIGSQAVRYWPGRQLGGGRYRWDVGTAGSTTMLALTVLPIALHCEQRCHFELIGGLFQDMAPSALHLESVLLPLLRRMGASVRLHIARPGYVPRGRGRLILETEPSNSPLSPLRLPEPGSPKTMRAVSLSSHLQSNRVSERMADECRRLLEKRNWPLEIDLRHDTQAEQKGAALLLWTETTTGALLGADRAGKPGRPSEAIARYVVETLFEDLEAGATTDRYTADQLILFAGLAAGVSDYRIPRITDHIESNIWMVSQFLGVSPQWQGRRLTLRGAPPKGAGIPGD